MAAAKKTGSGSSAPGPDTSARLARLAAAALKDANASAREKALAGGVLANTRPGTVSAAKKSAAKAPAKTAKTAAKKR